MKPARQPDLSSRLCPATGFTLIEMLVVIAIIGVLAGMMLPALNRARARADGIVCLGNLKQLQVAWQAYTGDHNGRYPENHSELIGRMWRSSFHSWCGPSSAPYDPDPRALQLGTFGRYGYVASAEVYRCPGDDSSVQQRPGADGEVLRTRSYAMNGNFGGRSKDVQTVLWRESFQFSPSQICVFIDEADDSIDDGHFLVWPAPDDRWVNLPAGRHDRTGTLSFVDGHAELWRWKWRKRFNPKETYWKRVENAADRADLERLQQAALPKADYQRQP